MTEITITLEISEICQSANITGDVLLEVVELGIIAPRNKMAQHWQFDGNALYQLKRALRIRREFELDWPGTALSLCLFEQIEQLKSRNQLLEQQLKRFLVDER